MIEPDGRRVRLTAAAELLLRHAHEIFTHLEHAESDLARFRDGEAGTVRLGAFATAIRGLAAPLLRRIETTSGLRVEIVQIDPEDAVDALLARRVDVALTLTAGASVAGAADARLRALARRGRHPRCRAAAGPPAGRPVRGRAGRPRRGRLDSRDERLGLPRHRPGRLRARRLLTADPSSGRGLHRVRRADRGRCRRRPAPPAGPGSVPARAGGDPADRRAADRPPDRGAVPRGDRRSAAHRAGAGGAAGGRRLRGGTRSTTCRAVPALV